MHIIYKTKHFAQRIFQPAKSHTTYNCDSLYPPLSFFFLATSCCCRRTINRWASRIVRAFRAHHHHNFVYCAQHRELALALKRWRRFSQLSPPETARVFELPATVNIYLTVQHPSTNDDDAAAADDLRPKIKTARERRFILQSGAKSANATPRGVLMVYFKMSKLVLYSDYTSPRVCNLRTPRARAQTYIAPSNNACCVIHSIHI